MKHLHNIMNKQILGTGAEGMSASWSLPLEGAPNKEEIGNISFNKNRARKIVESMEDLLITVCVVPERQLQWKNSVRHVATAFKKARKHAKYTDNDILEFQYHCDQFNVNFLSLHGANVSTNYIHYLSSGHFYQYMYKYRSLYIYSQESWEATNNLIKSFYFRRTQRGGACGKNGKKIKLYSIGKWYQRRTLFLCGHTKEYFLNYEFPEGDDGSDNNNEQIDEEAEDGDADNMRDSFSLDEDIPEEDRPFHSNIRDRTIITQNV